MKQIEISNYIYVLIMLLVFGCSTMIGQTFATNETFKDNIAKDITVVEFWADWNKANQFNELIKLKDTNVYRVDIMHCSSLQVDYNITAIPTVVIFDNGVEKERFNANIMFQLEADKKVIQNSIDTIILNKFQ
jgi:thioredoxin-related protein